MSIVVPSDVDPVSFGSGDPDPEVYEIRIKRVKPINFWGFFV